MVTGVLNWTGGAIAGFCTISTGAVMNVSGPDGKFLSGTLTNAGTVNMSSSITMNSPDLSKLYNLAGGLVDLQGDVGFGGDYRSVFTNAGVLRKSTGSGTSYVLCSMLNRATMEILSGTLEFDSQTGLLLLPSSILRLPIGGANPGQFGRVV